MPIRLTQNPFVLFNLNTGKKDEILKIKEQENYIFLFYNNVVHVKIGVFSLKDISSNIPFNDLFSGTYTCKHQHIQSQAHFFLLMFSTIIFLEPRFTCDVNSVKLLNFAHFCLILCYLYFFLPRTLFNLQ